MSIPVGRPKPPPPPGGFPAIERFRLPHSSKMNLMSLSFNAGIFSTYLSHASKKPPMRLAIRRALNCGGSLTSTKDCFSASNIATVAQARRHAFVLADHDKPVAHLGGLGTGEFYARRTGLPWAMPPELGTDANDLHTGAGLPALQTLLLELMHRRTLQK